MKYLSLLFILCLPLGAQDRLPTLDAQLRAITTTAADVDTVGLIFNPKDVALEGTQVTVKTLAVPATNGPVLIKNARAIMGRVQAVYLVKGKIVTTPKFASFIVKLAQKKGIGVYTNDPDLKDVDGVNLVAANSAGNFRVAD
ncbi:MAG: hypothetical protein QNK37_31925 [Acidobacteriota bacterium]|nr:hypothetical protein [Acidobacteriota bacterium]